MQDFKLRGPPSGFGQKANGTLRFQLDRPNMRIYLLAKTREALLQASPFPVTYPFIRIRMIVFFLGEIRMIMYMYMLNHLEDC